MKSEVITKKYVECPSCHKYDFSIDHIWNDNKKYQWVCSHCKKEIELHSFDNSIEVRITGKGYSKALSFLRYQDLGFVVKGTIFDNNDYINDKRYFYEEHTCPINIITSTVAILDLKNKDADMHGLFEYCTTKAVDPDLDYDQFDFEDWKDFFEKQNLLE